MTLINVSESFKYAIGGNRVVEFPAGTHDVSEEIAICAITDLKIAEVTQDKKDLLPKLTHDVNGDSLSENDLSYLDPAFVSVNIKNASKKSEKKG